MDGGLTLVPDGAARSRTPDVPAPTNLEDAFNGYRLFLGRHPHSIQELTAATDCMPAEFLASYLMRGEFLTGVVESLSGNRMLPHVALAPAPDDALARWALERLPLSAASQEQLASSRSWRFWLLTILRDEAFRSGLPAAVAEWLARSGLQGRLTALALAPTRQLIGEASHDGAGTVSGWCANASDASERVVLELHLGGRFIGAVRCDRFVSGLGDRIGGSGDCGFAFNISAAYAELAARGAMLRLCDAQSKAPFGSEIYVKTNLPAALDDLSRMLTAIQSVKELLTNLERQMPYTLRHISPPLSAYGTLAAQGILACHRPLAGPAARAAADVTVNVILLETALAPAPLRRLLASLEGQSHDRWTLTVLADEDRLGDEVRVLLRPLEAEGRLTMAAPASVPRLLAGHPARAAAAHLVVGRAGTLRSDALAAFLAALEPTPEPTSASPGSVAYSDHDVRLAPHNGKPAQLLPVFKPGFDPVMLLAYDYAGPMVMVTADALLKAYALVDGAPLTGLHDLMLRLSDCAVAGAIRHIPSVLYSLEQPVDLRDIDGLPRLLVGDSEAVEAWAERWGLAAEVRRTRVASEHEETGQTLVEPCEIAFRPVHFPAVSVIVPTRNAPILLRNCLDSLLRTRQAYPGPMQILVIDHENEDPDSVALIAAMQAQRGVDVLPYRGPFNWAQMNNLAAEQASGEVLVFLNDDTMAADPRWLTQAVTTLELPEVGVVGARLLYGDGSIQHAGVITSLEQGAVHDGRGMRGEEGGYLGRNLVLRTAAAVTGACMVTRRSVFEGVKGFDPAWPVDWNDIVYCLTVRRAGWRVAYDPAVCLYHLESKTRGYLSGQAGLDSHRNNLNRIVAAWGAALDDPFYSPAFNRLDEPFRRIAL
ncbi:glycosyltransferase [Azospirillum sp. TSO35-2]|uniref:glycosyltransferase family 2 protein n=1 Tax=Azospirillum sp. TSO35-2 TaxID=716796 RepID=UPI000D610919|nr:glycosyltransferase [Azospirillum sp. TSO35-2]PWC40469.1 hypothetical protein TSO352_01165 [Azospirillum sp. TSO35-2]